MNASKVQFESSGELLETLFTTTHALHHRFETILAEHNLPSYITGPRLRVMIAIQDSGKIHMNDLAARLRIRPRTVTQFIDALERAGVVMRVPDPADRRATLLELTDDAPNLIQQARTIMKQAADKVLEPLPTHLRSPFLESLRSLNLGADS